MTPPPPRSSTWLWMLVAAAVLSQTSTNLARPIMSYKALALGGDAVAVGVISAAFALLPVAVALGLGRLSDRTRWLKPLIILGLVLLALSSVLLALAPNLLLVGLASAMLGLGHMAFTIAGQSAIAKLAPAHRIDAGFGWFTAGFAIGQLLGPLLAGILLGANPGGSEQRMVDINQALLLAGAISLLALPTALIRFTGRAPGAARPPRGRAGTVARAKLRADGAAAEAAQEKESVLAILARPGVKANMLASLALLATLDILLAFLPLIGEEHGVAPLAVGVLLALRAAATILSRLLLTVLLRRWSRDQLVFASLLGAAVGLAAMPFLLDYLWLAGASLLLAGFFLGLGQPLTMVLISGAVRPGSRGTALAIRLLGNRIGQVALPVAAGVVAAPVGPSGAIWMTCLVMGLTAGAKLPSARRPDPEKPAP